MDGELGNPDDDAGFFGSIIGGSPAAKTMLRIIKRVADSPSPVLITGETGTGKELAARSIHEQSKRNKYPFVAINCSSIPENLFESELFGYEEGAFTGARKGGKMGKIEMAQGGTLFLDEIGELPLSIQPKLLRILQEYELERVGSNKKIHLDVRIIAATNRDLSEMVEEKTFREDLFYRLNVINLKLPPLRERKGDIMPIAENYLKKLHLKMETPLQSFSEEVRERFAAYPWPGNVRELQNAIEYAANDLRIRRHDAGGSARIPPAEGGQAAESAKSTGPSGDGIRSPAADGSFGKIRPYPGRKKADRVRIKHQPADALPEAGPVKAERTRRLFLLLVAGQSKFSANFSHNGAR